jgi:hypothetical protein
LNEIAKNTKIKGRSTFVYLYAAFTISLVLFVWYVVQNDNFNPLIDYTVSSSILISAIIAVVWAIRLLTIYLRPTSSENSDIDFIYEAIINLLPRLECLEATIGIENSDKVISNSEREKILSSLQSKLESDAMESYLQKLEELAYAKLKNDTIEQGFKGITTRLENEIKDLAKRGNLNLIIGIIITMVGLIALSYSVFNLPTSYKPEELLAYFIPRVSLVFLIEVFAYFFLRLYKQSLSEIKYFQNETTNIEAKHLAIHIASRTNDPALLNRVVDELVKTERNFILGKDQTTVELERDRMSRSSNNEILAILKDLLKTK